MPETRFANLPEPPYYAVMFSSQRRETNNGFSEMADLLERLSQSQPGFLGAESARDASGFGITISYWRDQESIANWRVQVEHLHAQKRGKNEWFQSFELRVAKVERASHFRA